MLRAGCCALAQQEPFHVRLKEFWPLMKAESFITRFIPSLSHEADGLILQRAWGWGWGGAWLGVRGWGWVVLHRVSLGWVWGDGSCPG